MSEPNSVSRREFLGATAASLAAPAIVPGSALGQPGKPGANDKIAVALIGCGGMGMGNLANCAGYPDVVVAGVCDVWRDPAMNSRILANAWWDIRCSIYRQGSGS